MIQHKIAGLNFQIKGPTTPMMEILRSELAIYPDSDGPADVVIAVCKKSELTQGQEILSRNPTLLSTFENGVSMDFGQAQVYWSTEPGTLQIRFAPNASKKWLHKIRSMQFTHQYETIGQVFHELVLVPTIQMFFSDRFAVLHGSAIKSPDDEVFVFGGTGGVGKTSLMLELVENRNYRFVADDITILDKHGSVQANFAYPKIYGYNTLGYPEMKKKLLSNRSLANRLAWELKIKRGGPSKVRRRINPEQFFTNGTAHEGKLTRLYILFRTNSAEVNIEQLSSSMATEMNLQIMNSEYGILYNQLHWYHFNCLGSKNQVDQRLDFESIWNRSREIQMATLKDVECLRVDVPMQTTAQELKKQMLKLI